MIHYPVIPGFTGSNFTEEDFDLTTTAEQATFLPTNQFDGISDSGRPLNETQPGIVTFGNGVTVDVGQLKIAARYMYTYNSEGDAQSGFAGWNALQTDGAIAQTGLGFIMKGVHGDGSDFANFPNYRQYIEAVPNTQGNVRAGQRYDFRGRPNNGTITIGVANDNVTLAGNPYPSALDLKQFLEEATTPNVLINPEIFFYETIQADSHNFVEQLSGYAVYTPLGFETGVNDGYANNGVYTSATFTRIDNNGIINTTVQTGGGNTTSGARRYAAIGQGFFIARTNTEIPETQTSLAKTATPNITAGVTINAGLGITGEEVSFNNGMRRWIREDGSTSVFYRGASTSSVPLMTLNVVTNNQYVRPLNFVFDDNTTTGYDFGWEGVLNGRNDDDAYIKIDRSEYGLSSQPYAIDARIPIGISVDATRTTPISIEFEIAQMENFNPPNVYIYDAQTNLYHDVTNSNHTMMLPGGHYVDRFFVTFTNRTLSAPVIEAFADVTAYQNNAAMELTVFNPQAVELKSIDIYDLAGRLVTSSNPSEVLPNYTFDTSSYSQGIYIVKMVNIEDQQKSVKVSVSNR
jgi:hypothetical protein